MAREQFCVYLAMAAAAAMGGAAFATAGQRAATPDASVPGLRGGRPGYQMPEGDARLLAAPLLSISALALGAAAWSSQRRVNVAASAVLTKNSAGNTRFALPVIPYVMSEQPGATAPLGFFDPLGFSKNALMTFGNDPNGGRHLREAEIKHGRVCMMASIGSVSAHYFTFPGFENVPTGLKALSDPLGSTGFAVLFFTVGIIEAVNWKPKDEPGSYGDPFNFGQYTPDFRNREINNGRMAMFALMGQLVAELVTGDDPVQQFGL